MSARSLILVSLPSPKITAKEITNWPDQIMNIINVKKSWQSKGKKSKRSNANWIKHTIKSEDDQNPSQNEGENL